MLLEGKITNVHGVSIVVSRVQYQACDVDSYPVSVEYRMAVWYCENAARGIPGRCKSRVDRQHLTQQMH